MKQRLGTLIEAASILAFLLSSLSLPATAATIKGNSGYGQFAVGSVHNVGAVKILPKPGFNTISQNGFSMSLDAVWCSGSNADNSCAFSQPPGAFDYLFNISISSGIQLNSLTFTVPNGTMLTGNFGMVVLDSACAAQAAQDPAQACPVGASDTTYGMFTGLTITAAGNKVSFAGFNAATLGGTGPIVFFVTATNPAVATTDPVVPGMLSVTADVMPITPPPSPSPLVSSYKSIINIKNLLQGNKTCPAGWSAVADSGDGMDSFGSNLNLTEQLCANPANGEFFGNFTITHTASDAYFGVFNGAFVPSGNILEVHAMWRITGGKGQFSGIRGAGTGKGTASVVNGGPGPGSVLLDGSVGISKSHESE